MELLAILLVAASAFTHASWNLICKAKTPSGAFFLLLTVFSLLLTGTFFIGGGMFRYFSVMPPGFWKIILLTGFFQAVYNVTLANAYRRCEISVAYPLARSLPVVMTPLVTGICAFGAMPSGIALCGMGFIAAGCIVLPAKNGKDVVQFRVFRNSGTVFAVITAIFITSYSVADREGLRLIQENHLIENPFVTAWYFLTLEYAVIAMFLFPYVLAVGDERRLLSEMLKSKELLYPAAAALLCSGGYMLVLWAMQLVDNVSYVVAFRQLSIPLGAFLGFLLLKEKVTATKIAGLILIAAGLLFVAIN